MSTAWKRRKLGVNANKEKLLTKVLSAILTETVLSPTILNKGIYIDETMRNDSVRLDLVFDESVVSDYFTLKGWKQFSSLKMQWITNAIKTI